MNIQYIRKAASKFLNSVISTKLHHPPVISTKLHRPPVARDFVCREGLCDMLNASTEQPLTLVSAPAGYGKSSIVSHWLETCDHPSAWLSLDGTDSDVSTFLVYVVAACVPCFPRPALARCSS